MVTDMDEDRPDALTEEVLASLAGARSPRLRTITESLVRHLHAFVRETRPTRSEWNDAIAFLTRTGQTCTPSRQEFILLSDVLGVSMLVEELHQPGAAEATSATVTGPFYRPDPPERPLGADLAAGSSGTPLLVDCTVLAHGAPVAGAIIDTWQADGEGFYDVQRGDATALRARLRTDADGRFWYWSVVPADYPIPDDGPVGDLLGALGRHPYRPAHVHVRVAAPGHQDLVTHLFLAGSPYLASDAVFGVKADLICTLVTQPPGPAPDGRSIPTEYAVLRHQFVLAD
jgi:hydroxyquinol 1,2-dioxygenase